MKKLMIIAGMLFLAQLASGAEILGTTIKATLLDHVSYAMQFNEGGESRGVFVDSVILVGSHNGRSIFDIQGGIAANAKPTTPDETGINWIASGFFKVSTLLRDKVHLADHWQFLNSLEYGGVYTYDVTDKSDYVGLQLGLAFGLTPIK